MTVRKKISYLEPDEEKDVKYGVVYYVKVPCSLLVN